MMASEVGGAGKTRLQRSFGSPTLEKRTPLSVGLNSLPQIRILWALLRRLNLGARTLPLPLSTMEATCLRVAEKMGFQILEFNGASDHVHLLIEYPPALSAANLVNQLKGVSTRLLRKDFNLKIHGEHLWSPSYFASSAGGATIETLRQYVKEQDQPKE